MGEDLAAHRSGVAETETMLVRAAVLYRLFGLAQVALAVAIDVPRYRYPVATLGLGAAISVESTALAVALMRRRGFVSWMIGADTAFNMAALATGAALTAPAYGHTWVYFMYPFTLVSSVGIGLAYPRLDHVLGHSGVCSASMRVSVTSDRLAVSVLDHGRGFDLTAVPRGVGLRQSIQGRLHDAGGTACIESTPGAGTFVELSVPRRTGMPPPGRHAGTGSPGQKPLMWMKLSGHETQNAPCPFEVS